MDNKNINNCKDENSSKKIIIAVIFISILVISVIGISFAVFIGSQHGSKDNTLSTGTISMTYTEDTNGISIVNALPITDTAGKVLSGNNEYFDFTVTTNIVGNSSVIYEIAAIKDNSSTLKNDEIKLYLERQISGTYSEELAPGIYSPIENATEIGSPIGSMVLAQITRNSTTTDNYRLRMWINQSTQVDTVSKFYTVKVNVYGKTK